MKKITIFIISIVFMACFSAYAIINSPVSTPLNTSTYTAIKIPLEYGCRDIVVYTDDSSSFYIATNSTGTDEATVPAGSALSIDCVRDTSGIIMYAKASEGTPSLICIYGPKK